MIKKAFLLLLTVSLVSLLTDFGCTPAEKRAKEYDVLIYGGTSGGIAAAIQVKRMGKSVIVIEPGQRVGGLTTGGLGQTDIGNKAAIGGISREFYEEIRKYYENPANWKWQDKSEYTDGGQTRTKAGETAMWTFEPSAALYVYQDMIRQNNLEVIYGQHIDRSNGVSKKGSRIISIAMETGQTYYAKCLLMPPMRGILWPLPASRIPLAGNLTRITEKT